MFFFLIKQALTGKENSRRSNFGEDHAHRFSALLEGANSGNYLIPLHSQLQSFEVHAQISAANNWVFTEQRQHVPSFQHCLWRL